MVGTLSRSRAARTIDGLTHQDAGGGFFDDIRSYKDGFGLSAPNRRAEIMMDSCRPARIIDEAEYPVPSVGKLGADFLQQ